MKIFGATVLILAGLFLVFGRPAENVRPIFEPSKPMAETRPTSILVVGDIMLGRAVQTLEEKFGNDYPFRAIKSFVSGYDLAIGNLEGPIVPGAAKTENFSFKFSFPTSSAASLKEAGFDHVDLANNHTGDLGAPGYAETQKALASARIGYFGHPLLEDGYSEKVEAGGRKFIFLGFNATYPSFSAEGAARAVSDAKASAASSTVFVFMHWGEEYALAENESQRELARSLIDSGADAVFGSHPHVVQGIETYNGKPIFYSLGNFIFDQYFSEDTQEALAIGVDIGSAGAKFDLLPLDGRSSQPKLMDEFAAGKWLKKLADRSAPELAAEIMAGSINIPAK